MKNFVLFLRANTNMSPEAFSAPKELELREAWLKNIQDSGAVVNLGGTMPPIPNMATTIFADGSTTPGAFKEVSHFLTGFLIVKAESLENALALAKTNPILVAGGSVEVREILLR